MGQLVELIVTALIGWVPDHPRWAMWLVIALYLAVVLMGLVVAVDALA